MNEIEELNRLVEELRVKLEEKGRSEAELKEIQEKLNTRIDELEARIMRPPLGETGNVQTETTKAFVHFIREGKAGLTPEERKALVENQNGQILVPEDVEAELYRQLPMLTVIRQLATVKQTRSDRVRRRSINEAVVDWGKLETGNTIPQDNFTAGEAYIYIEDLYGLSLIGEDELMDTDLNLQSFIIESFARAIAEKEEEGFIVGQGHTAGKPEGVIPNITSIETITPSVLTADDLLRLIYKVPAQYRTNGTLLVNSQTEYAMRIMKDAVNGQYLWQPALAAGTPATFAGYPIRNCEFIPNIAVNNVIAVFGDFRSGYTIYDRLGTTLQRLDELYSVQGMVGFKIHSRVGGAVVRSDALCGLKIKAGTGA